MDRTRKGAVIVGPIYLEIKLEKKDLTWLWIALGSAPFVSLLLFWIYRKYIYF